MRSGRVRLRFENRNRDFELDGVRVFMGETTVFSEGSLYVSKIDVIKTIVPLLNPAEHAGQLPAPPRLIVLDAGHGGIDPGTRNLALHLDEKNLTLDVVLRLKKLLERRGYRVILTRSDDTKLAPAQRTDLELRDEVANRAKADLFLSVHFNSAAPTVTGTETYVMTPQFQTSSGGWKGCTWLTRRFPATGRISRTRCWVISCTAVCWPDSRPLIADTSADACSCSNFSECPAALVEAAYLSSTSEGEPSGDPGVPTADRRSHRRWNRQVLCGVGVNARPRRWSRLRSMRLPARMHTARPRSRTTVHPRPGASRPGNLKHPGRIEPMNHRTILPPAVVAILFVLAGPPAHAWDYEGHRIINELALASLPADFPAFVREPAAAERIAFLSGEPDRWRNVSGPSSPERQQS